MFTSPDRIGQLAREHHHQMLAQASQRQLAHQHSRPSATTRIIRHLAVLIAEAGVAPAQTPGTIRPARPHPLGEPASRTQTEPGHPLCAMLSAEDLGNIAGNPKVSLGLDVADIGRNVVRVEGTAAVAGDQPAANQQPAYLAKYTERIGAMFDTPERFAELFSTAVIITPTKLRI